METRYRLGVRTSYSFQGLNNVNGKSESPFRTSEYRSDYPMKEFADMDEASRSLLEFDASTSTVH